MIAQNICYFAAVILSISVSGFPQYNKIQAITNDFPFYTRADWGARTPSDPRPLNTPVPYVVIHHTYIPGACNNFTECSAAMKIMQDAHISQNWGDIGYNFCVGSDGAAYEGRGWRVLGIHAGRANNFSIGISVIGDWRVELPPQDTLETTKSLIDQGISLGVISPTYKLIGHRQAMATECPGDALINEVSTWKHYVPGFINF